MDPDACLKELLDACRDHDREMADIHANALFEWIRGGGFLPRDPRQSVTGDANIDAVTQLKPHRSRFDDALFAQSGACNPRALALSLFRHMCQATTELGGTDAVRRDPALRLITHQLAYLMGLEFGWSGNEYEETVQAVADKASPEIVAMCAPSYARAPN